MFNTSRSKLELATSLLGIGPLLKARPQPSRLGAAIEVRLLGLLVEQCQAGLRATASVILMAMLVAPFVERTTWIVWIVTARAVAMAVAQYFVVQLADELKRGLPDRRTVHRVSVANGVSAFVWGAMTWPLVIGASLDFMSFLIVIIALFSICLSVVTAGLHRPTMTATAVGGALGLAPKIVMLTPQIGYLLPLGFAVFEITIFAYALMLSRQAQAGVLIQLRADRYATRLAEANRALEKALKRSNWLADRDALTELRNRRAFENGLKGFTARHAHRRHCLLLLDIDHFKQINDRFGHATGDGVLVAVGTALRQWERDGMGRMTGRWGGEEFIALVALRKGDSARAIAEDLRRRIEALGEQLHWPATVRLTASIGCTPLAGPEDFDAALSRADLALFAAKDSGRNRCKLAA